MRKMLAGLVLALVALVGEGRPAASQQTYDTLRMGYYKTNAGAPLVYIPGSYVPRLWAVHAAALNAPASTANADSILVGPMQIVGYGYQFTWIGTFANNANGKAAVATIGSTTIDSILSRKSVAGQWVITCHVLVRSATAGAQTQVVACHHQASSDSSATPNEGVTVATVSIDPSLTTTKLAVHNAVGTGSGDVTVQGGYVLYWGRGFKVNTP
jgi:hypothetical protein